MFLCKVVIVSISVFEGVRDNMRHSTLAFDVWRIWSGFSYDTPHDLLGLVVSTSEM